MRKLFEFYTYYTLRLIPLLDIYIEHPILLRNVALDKCIHLNTFPNWQLFPWVIGNDLQKLSLRGEISNWKDAYRKNREKTPRRRRGMKNIFMGSIAASETYARHKLLLFDYAVYHF